LEDVKEFRQDTAVIETNIHYPTNNSLVWDCIKESERLLSRLKEEIETLTFEEYKKKAKKTYFKINVEKNEEKRVKMFKKQLETFTKCINQVSHIVKKKVRVRNNNKSDKTYKGDGGVDTGNGESMEDDNTERDTERESTG